MGNPRPPPARARAAPGGDERVVELTRRLASVLSELGLSEVEVESADVRVRVQRTRVLAPPVGGPALVTVEAPMVGTFYRASSPTADPYVQEGDVVKEGQVLCIIEAMKLMNEIAATT